MGIHSDLPVRLAVHKLKKDLSIVGLEYITFRRTTPNQLWKDNPIMHVAVSRYLMCTATFPNATDSE